MEKKDILVAAGIAAGAFAVGGILTKLYDSRRNGKTDFSKTIEAKSFARKTPVLEYIEENSLRENSIMKDLKEYTIANVDNPIMLADPIQVQFIQLFLKSFNAKKCLEVGTYTGYNALSVALSIPEDGRVYALDISERFVNHGKPFFEKANVAHKINIMIAPANDSLQKLISEGHSGTFDFAYIDADKPGYNDYYEKCLVLLQKGGVIIFDNMIYSGSVIDHSLAKNESNRIDAIALRKLASILKDDQRVDVSFLNVGDGTYIVRKR